MWRHPLFRVSRKQRYNTLDFPTENRVPTGMLAPLLEALRQVGHDLWRQQFVVFCFEVERSHALPSFEFQFHQISSNDAIIVYP